MLVLRTNILTDTQVMDIRVKRISVASYWCALTDHTCDTRVLIFLQLARAAQDLDVPYIASGGIADGRGLAAALALGACVRTFSQILISCSHSFCLQGVNMGTLSNSAPGFHYLALFYRNSVHVHRGKVNSMRYNVA